MQYRPCNFRHAISAMQFQPYNYSHAISAKQFAYLVSMPHNLMDALWWRNEDIEMQVCKLSMALEKLKFDK